MIVLRYEIDFSVSSVMQVSGKLLISGKFDKKFMDFRKFCPVQKNRKAHFSGYLQVFQEI